MNSNHRIGWGLILLMALLVLSASRAAGVNVLTYHNNNARTGANLNETNLTPATVASADFGKLFSYAVDGYVYAQPLVVTGVTIPCQGVHDVVYVATEHDSVYAFDANSNAVALWSVSFLNPAAGITTVSSTDVNCEDLIPEVGITSTPVIDAASGTIYICAKTKEITNSVTNYFYRLHALDLTTGAEKFGGPVVVTATVAGSGDGSDGNGQVTFNPLTQFNRAALLLNKGVVYIGSAAHCDNGPYHGWLIGYDAKTLKQRQVFNSTPNGGEGGIWQAGGGPAADTKNNLYAITGNGTFDPSVKGYGDSFLKLSAAKKSGPLKVADYFTPYNQDYLAAQDLDLGSGGAVVLPDAAGGRHANRHLLVGAGKEGTIYLLNRDNFGHYNAANNNQIVQSLPQAIGGSFDTPAYFNNQLYYVGVGDVLKAFAITNAQITTTPVAQGADLFGFPGATPSVSANGTKNGIVWALQTDAYDISAPAILQAYNATNVANALYHSNAAGERDRAGGAVKFSVPTIANGKVYVGGQYALTVYGLGHFTALPIINPPSGVFTNAISVTITDATPAAIIRYTLDGSAANAGSPLYTGPFTLTNSAGVKACAFASGAIDSLAVAATFISTNDLGTGIGLAGSYFTDQFQTFTNPPTLQRVDATVDFDWSRTSPDPSISVEDFTVRWNGTVQPQFNETYTFYTTTDDGARLWVNGQLLIDEWQPQAATEWSGSIALNAGQNYALTLEYFQATGDAVAQLAWSSPSLVKAIIPASQLYPVFPPEPLLLSANVVPGGFKLQVRRAGQSNPVAKASGVGACYVLQASTNLVDWVSVQTNTVSVGEFTDSAAKDYPRRFYRVRQLP